MSYYTGWSFGKDMTQTASNCAFCLTAPEGSIHPRELLSCTSKITVISDETKAVPHAVFYVFVFVCVCNCVCTKDRAESAASVTSLTASSRLPAGSFLYLFVTTHV